MLRRRDGSVRREEKVKLEDRKEFGDGAEV